MDILINQKENFKNNRTNVVNLDGYFQIVYNNLIHNGEGNFPDDRLKKELTQFYRTNKNW